MRGWLVFSLLVVVACGDRAAFWDEPLRPLGPVVSGDTAIFAEALVPRAIVLRPLEPARAIPLDAEPRDLVAVEGGAVILGDGALLHLSLDGEEVRRVPLPRDFDRLHVSPDGARAFASFDPLAKSRSPIRDLNEVAVIDLPAGPVRLLSLRTESLAPRSFHFTDSLSAVVLESAVVLVDHADGDRTLHVPLRIPGGAVLEAREATFSADGSYLFVRAHGVDDVVAIGIERGEGQPLDASINFLFHPGARGLKDILVFDGSGDAVAALYDGLGVLLDASGDTTRNVAAGLPTAADALIELGDGILLAYGKTVRIAAWEPSTGRADNDQLPGNLQATPRTAAGVALFASTGKSGGTAVRVTVDVEPTRLRLRQQPFGLSGLPRDTSTDPATGRFVVAVATDEGKGALVAIDEAGRSSGVELDEPQNAVELVGSFVLTWELDGLGRAAAFDVDRLTTREPEEYEAFFAAGLMERK